MAGASRIDCVRRSPDGDIASFAGTDADGRGWTLSRDELISALESGQRMFYVSFEGHSHLVAIKRDAGRKLLVTFIGELEALRLPECR